MNNLTCPSDEELIPLLVGETLDGSIDAHIRDCSSCRRRLDLFQSDLNALRAVSVKMPAVAAPPPRPSRIGKFLIVGSLDSGGQANVYRAIHPTLDKELAIKLSRHPVGRLSDQRPLLIAEGKLLAKLDHPGLARIYDLDFHEDLPFLAMEYVRGPNLRQYAANGPVTPRKAASIVADVGRALAVVHSHGIVHQDIKPQNILMDENQRPRLIDFGMARIHHAWDDSAEGATGGTPAFMSPEQARGDLEAVGPRSDVFALGGVLYFLLTNRPPFVGEYATEVLGLASQCSFDREALERPGVPRRLREICLKAMSLKPADRYARVEDLVVELDRYLNRPRQLARIATGGIAALIVATIAVGFVKLQPKKEVVNVYHTETPPPLEVLIVRNGQTFDLPAALPLEPKSDKVQVVARIPPGHHATMIHINGKGKIDELTFRESPADGYTKLIFPAKEGTLETFEQWPGNEVVAVFAAENSESLTNLDQMTGQYLIGQPVIPAKAAVWLGPDETNRQSRSSFGGAELDAVAKVESQLDQLRLRLNKKNLSVIRAVVYSRDGANPK